ncbi:hypothetical protein [Stenotrophomonas sp. TWI1409]|uniref:hypothetical protein n=1 Tax=unclassified Stenotrophomonas TaxID=196198 RepID=UPI0032084B0F
MDHLALRIEELDRTVAFRSDSQAQSRAVCLVVQGDGRRAVRPDHQTDAGRCLHPRNQLVAQRRLADQLRRLVDRKTHRAVRRYPPADRIHRRMVQRKHRHAAVDIGGAEATAFAALVVVQHHAGHVEGALVLQAIDDRCRCLSGQRHADHPRVIDDIDAPCGDALVVRCCYARLRCLVDDQALQGVNQRAPG